jgi:nickel transport protein
LIKLIRRFGICQYELIAFSIGSLSFSSSPFEKGGSRGIFKMRPYRIFMLILVGSFLVTGNTWAHRVNVFAWAEGDIVYVEGKFSGGKNIAGGTITVTDSSGVVLLTGRTNEQGEFSFKRPQLTDLKIILNAGMGHRAQWVLPADDGHAGHPADDVQVEKANARSKPISPDDPINHQHAQTQTAVYAGPSRAEIEAIVEKALDKKMKPVFKMLAESNPKGPGFGDVLGGIGYIIGLVGIAAYFHNRRKKN